MESADRKLAELESIIFVSGKPIGYRRLAEMVKQTEEEVKSGVRALQARYHNESRGIRLLTKEDAVQMVTAPDQGELVGRYLTFELQENLSAPALETLAIIAYRGPITRARVEAIRGVNCIYILRNLLIRGLIDKKRSTEDARMSVYEVSFAFLKHVGAERVHDLPNYLELHKETSYEEYLRKKEAEALEATQGSRPSAPDSTAETAAENEQE